MKNVLRSDTEYYYMVIRGAVADEVVIPEHKKHGYYYARSRPFACGKGSPKINTKNKQ